MSPSMLRMLGNIFAEFNKIRKPISVCGELAGDPVAAIVLYGLGLRKFSMNASNIARVKRMLSNFTLDEMEAIAETVQSKATQDDVIAYLETKINNREKVTLTD